MKKSRSRNFWSNVAGTAAIEFAVLAVPFLGVTTSAFEAGRAVWTLEALQDSATQGARCIGVQSSPCYASGAYSAASVVAHIQKVASAWGVDVPSNAITATEETNCGNVAGFSAVRISYTFSSVAGKLIPALDRVPLSASSCFPHNS
ncbi:MAG TPA: TadE/TadG family type IV pilus assembly protein [Rhizomicrobium sp.]|jgi:Flp pilus assembly protein TadG|nr:TadE/TadG family type IV pilus assembly protein [Rhizomicrobium sp.]